MPLLRINATGHGLSLHGSAQSANDALMQAGNGRGPTVVMVHGYKYSPLVPAHCPHARIFHPQGWPAALGVQQDDTLGIAFGWSGWCRLTSAYGTAIEQGRNLARVIAALRARGPVHLIAHSLGATLALAALPYLKGGDVGRIVLLSGAAHLGLAQHALDTPAGQSCALFHVTSRENALFDLAFEQIIQGTGAIGRGLDCPQAMRLAIDCPETLARLRGLGYPLAAPRRRICHWSSYTRPGVMALNAALLFGQLEMSDLRKALAPQTVMPRRRLPLALTSKTRIMGGAQINKGPCHEHAY